VSERGCDTEFLRSTAPRPRRARYLDNEPRTNVFHLPVPTGDGGVYSTVADLHASGAHSSPRIVTPTG
jgi:hypothetical protein